MLRIVLFLLLSVMLTSCGYRLGPASALDTNRSIMVPYVKGDLDGTFTQELIREVCRTTELRYSSCGGDMILCASLIDRREEPIGYRYERNYEDQVGKRLVTSEERVTLTAEVKIIDARTQKVVVGPYCISERINYDFAPETSPQNETRPSLGQLDFRPAALNAARVPLHRSLAKKIVDFLINAS